MLGKEPVVELLKVSDLQRADPVLCKVIDCLKGSVQKPSEEDLKEFDKDVVLLLRQWDKLNLQGDVLYRTIDSGGQKVDQLVVPSQSRSKILHSLHDDMAHVGRDRTADLLCTRFYWPGMFSEVEDYVKN